MSTNFKFDRKIRNILRFHAYHMAILCLSVFFFISNDIGVRSAKTFFFQMGISVAAKPLPEVFCPFSLTSLFLSLFFSLDHSSFWSRADRSAKSLDKDDLWRKSSSSSRVLTTSMEKYRLKEPQREGRKKVRTILLGPFLVFYFFLTSGNIRYCNTLFIKEWIQRCASFLPFSLRKASLVKPLLLLCSWLSLCCTRNCLWRNVCWIVYLLMSRDICIQVFTEEIF